MSTGTNQALSFACPKYPLDKIYYRPAVASTAVSQSASPVVPTFTTVNITNTKNELFFLDVQLSTDGSTWYDLGSEPFYYSAVHALSFKKFIGLWGMTTSTISLQLAALDASYNIYYRMVGYAI